MSRVLSDAPGRILAMGGGGFTMEEASPALDRLVLELTGRAVPRICFLPTASGDPREQITRFYERYGEWPCEPSTISLFHLGRDRIDPVAALLQQDAIYVGGGSMRNMLAIWREHGIAQAMRRAWGRGTVVAGLSAGAMCWFSGGISMSGGAPEVVAGLGLLPGSLSVHLDGEPERLAPYRAAVATGALPGGYAVADGAALVYHGRSLHEAVASDPAARVVRVTRDPRLPGGVREEPVRVRALEPAIGREPALTLRASEAAVAELRAQRVGRHRWQ